MIFFYLLDFAFSLYYLLRIYMRDREISIFRSSPNDETYAQLIVDSLESG